MARVSWLVAALSLVGAAFGQDWQNGPATGFRYWRFDGEFFPQTGKVYFLGGRLSNGNTDGSIWSFDPVTGAYVDLGVDMPKPVSNYDICYLRDDYNLPAGDTYGLYIFGGRLGVSPNNPTDTVQVYYPVSNTARVLPTDPFPGRVGGMPSSGIACVVNDNKVYVMGGFISTASGITSETWMFDPLAPAGSRWTRLRNMNFARCYVIGVAVDSFVFAMGGDTWDGTALYARATCERLNTRDTAAGWTVISSLPKATGEARGFGFGGDSPYEFQNKVIIAGRGTWTSESAHCFIYDVITNGWDTFPRLRQARRNHAGALIPGTQGSNGVPGIWVWGGRQVNDTLILTTSEFYQLSYLPGVAEEVTKRNGIVNLLPNPARAADGVSCSFPVGTEGRLDVFDVTGKLILSRWVSGELRLKGLAAGVYPVRVKAGDREVVTKLTVIR